jgi:outer membrane protein OmpA-like peptidoglycan-associated protein
MSNISARIICAVAVAMSAVSPAIGETAKIRADRYNPVLAQTPDGCQVWLIDDGWEGYSWNRTDRAGKPICMAVESCLVANTDQMFDTDSARLRPGETEKLKKFFQQDGVFSYAIHGHTDSRASDEYNMALSQRRANAVARVAQSVGARLAAVNGYGERIPVATNATAEGRQKNRRVEVVCFREIERN